jgi:hypothetical protein
MQAHTRKHPTEKIELRFIGPIDNMAVIPITPSGLVGTVPICGLLRIVIHKGKPIIKFMVAFQYIWVRHSIFGGRFFW